MKTTPLLERFNGSPGIDTAAPKALAMTLEILETLEETSMRLVRTLRQAAQTGAERDAGAIEYDSWHARSAGELEYESWH